MTTFSFEESIFKKTKKEVIRSKNLITSLMFLLMYDSSLFFMSDLGLSKILLK